MEILLMNWKISKFQVAKIAHFHLLIAIWWTKQFSKIFSFWLIFTFLVTWNFSCYTIIMLMLCCENTLYTDSKINILFSSTHSFIGWNPKQVSSKLRMKKCWQSRPTRQNIDGCSFWFQLSFKPKFTPVSSNGKTI